MSDNTFNVGDIVQLKSGGPGMTVAAVNGDKIDCTWFAYDAATCTHSDTFKTAMLKAWEKPDCKGCKSA